jgi:hypothetical protein
MCVRILLARAVEPDLRKAIQPEIVRLKLWMLAGEDQPGRNTVRIERLGNGGKLDRFGTSADDDNYTIRQPSP